MMDQEKMMKLQLQLSQNNNDLMDYIKDLDNWQDDIKIKENKLSDKTVQSNLPSIRNISSKKPKIKEKVMSKPKKIVSTSYSSWEKFDADKACEEIDKISKNDDIDILKLVDKFKLEGNDFFKKGLYKEALESYTKGLEIDQFNVNLISNRALILLKEENYAACEIDCNAVLALDNNNLKSLLRRGTARSKLKKYKEALDDFEAVLSLEKHNKQAQTEIVTLKQILQPIDAIVIKSQINEIGIVKAIYKHIDQRSKKPLKRIEILEVNAGKDNNLIKSQISHEVPNSLATTSVSLFNEKSIVNFDSTHDKKNLNMTVQTNNTSTKKVTSLDNLKTTEYSSLNSFQFQKAWKQFKDDDDQFFQYFSKINPKEYKQIFGECLECNMLSKIWSCLDKFYLTRNLDIKMVLLNLPRISRFEMNMMFINSEDKTILKNLIKNCTNLSSQEEIYLRNIYQP